MHNTRSERLWVDLVTDLSDKWRTFFQDLETHHGLNAEDGDHIWLLHRLFLEELNCELEVWTKCWNNHKMQLRGERNKSPMEMFLIGMVERETPGIQEWIAQQEDNLPEGIDGEHLGRDVAGNLVEDGQNRVPFRIDARPDELHEVECEPPGCPLSADEKERLDTTIAQEFGINQYRSMPERLLIWNRALELCHTLVQHREH